MTPPEAKKVLWFIATDRARNQEYLEELWKDEPGVDLALIS